MSNLTQTTRTSLPSPSVSPSKTEGGKEPKSQISGHHFVGDLNATSLYIRVG